MCERCPGKKVLYIASLGGPGSAGAVHIHNRGALFHSIGWNTAIVSELPYDGFRFPDNAYTVHRYLKPFPFRGKLRGAIWLEESLLGLWTCRQTKKIIQQEQPDAVIAYEAASCFLIRYFLRYCRKHRIRFITEVSEWMEPRDHPYPYRLSVLQRDYQRRQLDQKVGNIIAISQFLLEHYPETGLRKICIPPVFDITVRPEMLHRCPRTGDDTAVRLVFAGSLGRKDYLKPLLDAIVGMNETRIRITLDVVGPSPEEISEELPGEPGSYGITLHGRLPHEDALNIVRRADFSVLFRENRRYAKAGVSTKFCEAMSLGVPSICTAVGGTDLFVKDGVNGFLIADASRESIAACLEKLTALSSEEILAMKKHALKTAMDHFSYSAHADQLREFMSARKE